MKLSPNDIKSMKFPLWMWEKSNTADPDSKTTPSAPGNKDSVSIGGEKTGDATSRPYKVISVKPGLEVEVPVRPKAMPQKKWTILVYSGADNDLEPYQVQDVNDIENVGSSNDMNLLVQLDRGKKPTDISGGWAGARRFKIDYNEDPYNIDSPVLEDMGQINMADPKNLQNFIEWGITNYPAKNYMLIISSHGGGWEGAIKDDSHNGWMDLPDIDKALKDAENTTGKKIDILGFDACLMGQTEVAYQLRDSANYMVASQEVENAEGWPYSQILAKNVLKQVKTALMMKINLEPADMAKFLVKAAATNQEVLPTMSSVDMAKMQNVADASDRFAKDIINTDTPGSTIKSLIRKTQSFLGFKDQADFCKKIILSEDIKDEKLKDSAGELAKAINEAVMYEEHSPSYPGAHGLSVHLPSFRQTPSEKYRKTAFAKDTHWDEALEKLGNSKNDDPVNKAGA